MLLNLMDPLTIDTHLKNEEEVREHFNLNAGHTCIDAASHYSSCYWTIVEETNSDIDKGIKQLRRMVTYLESSGKKIIRVFLLTKKLNFKAYSTVKNIVLAINVTRKDKKEVILGTNKKLHVYLVQYGSTVESVRRKIDEVESSGYLS